MNGYTVKAPLNYDSKLDHCLDTKLRFRIFPVTYYYVHHDSGSPPPYIVLNMNVNNDNQISNFRTLYYAMMYISALCPPKKTCRGARWQSGNTLASHLSGRGLVPGTASSGKAGSCLLLVSSLQYRTLTKCMY